MPEYLLAVHIVEGQEPPAEEIEQIYKDVDAFNEELKATGAWVFAGGLHPSTPPHRHGRAGRGRRGNDHRWAVCRDQGAVGGFWVIDAPDLHAALALATKGAAACRGPLTDDRLRLIFTCCQPALAPGAQVALTLRLLAAWRP